MCGCLVSTVSLGILVAWDLADPGGVFPEFLQRLFGTGSPKSYLSLGENPWWSKIQFISLVLTCQLTPDIDVEHPQFIDHFPRKPWVFHIIFYLFPRFNHQNHQGIRQAARPVAKVAMAAAERSKTFQDLRFFVSTKNDDLPVIKYGRLGKIMTLTFRLVNWYPCLSTRGQVERFKSQDFYGRLRNNWNKSGIYPLINKHSNWKWPFIVDLPIKHGDFP